MLQARRIRNVADPSFPEVWRLYEKSFPLEERRPLSCQAQAMEREENFVCLRLQDGQGAFLGLLFYWLLPQGGIYVEHFAIDEGWRGQGLGRSALQMLAAQGRPVILEIEPVADAMTQRRLRFYESCGYVRLPYSHAQLPFRPGAASVPMVLMGLQPPMGEAEVRSFRQYLQNHIMQYREQ